MSRVFPQDRRWQGSQKGYFVASGIRSITLIIFVIIVVIEGILIRVWMRSRDYASSASPHNFWWRIGIFLLIDAIISLTLALLIYLGKLHPVTALVAAILAFGNWFAACFINVLLVYSNEISFPKLDDWRTLGYTEAVFQALIAVFYLAMMGYAAKAVHEWRKEKARRGIRHDESADRHSQELEAELDKSRVEQYELVQDLNYKSTSAV